MRLHLIDGTWELFRAHFSKRPGHRAPDGRELKATIGLVSSLLALLHDEAEAVTHVAAAFDNPIRSFRNALFDGYKTEEGVDPELLAQFDEAEAAVRALGITVWTMREHEADDGLATGAARFAGAVAQVRLMSPDKDLGQCLRGERVVQVNRLRETVIDEAGLRQSLGIAPASVPDLLALVGDTADGIPGLPGIGEKTAAALLGAYGHLEAIPPDPSTWTVKVRSADKIAATLTSHREEALLYRRLATLVTDAPVSTSLDALAWRGVPRDAWTAWCERVGTTSLRDRPKKWT